MEWRGRRIRYNGRAAVGHFLYNKSAMAMFFTSKLINKEIKAVMLGLTGWIGYYFAGAIISGNFLLLSNLPIEALQPIGSGVILYL